MHSKGTAVKKGKVDCRVSVGSASCVCCSKTTIKLTFRCSSSFIFSAKARPKVIFYQFKLLMNQMALLHCSIRARVLSCPCFSFVIL